MKKNKKHLSFRTIISFLLTFLLCCLLVSITIINRVSVERLTMEQLISEKSAKANEVISRLLYKTQTLAALVVRNDGQGLEEDFDRIAATIIDDSAILNLLAAPDGVVTNVYPLQGNEAVIGLDFFGEGAGNKEAILAKETSQLVFGGPFNLVQGGQALVGRLPVYTDMPGGNKKFWGLVSVTLKYPQALDGAGLNELQREGFAFEIWRINPDDNEKQIIADSGYKYNKYTNYIEKHISILNADWYFRILPVRAWYEYPETWVLIFLSACISFLVAFVMQNNSELKLLKSEFEDMAHTDSLTGIFNRRYFMEVVLTQVERASRLNNNSFIILIDVDYFKRTNDTHGHTAGDEALKYIAWRVKGIIRPYDIFARYGGDEFIIFVSDIDESAVQTLAERIRLGISETPIVCDGVHISISASFGIASVTPANDLYTAIKLADKALYQTKEEGRNKVVLYDASKCD